MDMEEIKKENTTEEVEWGGLINEFFWLCAGVNRKVLRQCPTDYAKYAEKAKIYSSNRMFDTISVWRDIFKGRLGDMTMLQWIIIALICDLVAFLLFALFRNYETI